MLQTFTED